MVGVEGWPAVSPADAWLRRIVDLAEEEAAELMDSVVDDVHVVLALSRPEAGSGPVLEAVGLDARRLRDVVLYVCGINEAHAAEREGRAYRRTGKNRRRLDRPRRVAPEAARIVVEARAEAEANGAPVVGADHLVVALCRRSGPPGYFGLTAAEARRRSGLRPRPAVFAHLPDLVAAAGVRRPAGRGPLVLGGGGEEVMATVVARAGRAQPRVVLVGAADPEGRAASRPCSAGCCPDSTP